MRLIDKDDLMRMVHKNPASNHAMRCVQLLDAILCAPPIADAVVVVRCKDCRYALRTMGMKKMDAQFKIYGCGWMEMASVHAAQEWTVKRMFAEMMKEICKERNSCFGCPCEYTCHALGGIGAPSNWNEDSLKSANRVLDRAMAEVIGNVAD